jgi:Adenylate and Guanylate cyclase catalytic domain
LLLCHYQFRAHSKELAKRSDAQVATIFGHANTVAAAITSHALSSNQTFPNVTLPTFHEIVKGFGQASPVLLFAPRVLDADRKGWEVYAKSQDWIGQELKYTIDATLDPGPVPTKIFPYSQVGDEKDHPDHHEHDDDEFLEGMKFPLWQVSPVPRNASIVKMDLFTHPSFEPTIETALFAGRDILSGVQDLEFLLSESHDLPVAGGTGPLSTAVIPVRDDFYEGSGVVGFVFGEVLWSALFGDVLPPSTEAIVAVVSDPCSRDFAFLIEGENATFLGYGPAENFTETAHSRYRVDHEIVEFVRANDIEAGIVQEDHREACDITLTLYSTTSYEESCQTSMPAVYTTVVVLVLVATIVTFAVYDFWVNRRQQTLLTDAKRADAIVSSLFPKHVQKRMMEEAKAQDDILAKGNWKGKLYPNHDPTATGPHGATIADLYADATILFADIVGFTQWSSCRVPSEVFLLLETIFTAFDEIAHHRGVYKVR